MNARQQFTVKPIAFIFLCLTLSLFSERAQAATVNIADGDVPGLIAAINAANASPGADTINLAPGGTYTLTAVAEDDGYAGGAGLPYIRSPLTINGNGATIQRSSAAGTPDFRIVYVLLSDLTLNGVTIRGGRGGNVNRGGGGIGMIGSNLNVADSTITDNVGFGAGGGGIGSFASTFTVENSTISNNTSFSGYGGGGILNFASQTRSTIVSSTIFENQNDVGRGDAIADAFSGPGTMVVKNSVLASPTRGVSDDCYAAPGVVVSQGHNIAGDGTCSLTGPGDMNSTNPLLGPLANNGGNTPTHALLNGSPAIDAIPLADCTNTAGIPITTDQRGVFRPQGARCDIGSYELVPSGGPDRYNDRQSFLTALCPTATTKTIDFTRKDDGSFITTPAADTYFETLTLSGVTFHQVQSYYNSAIYYFPTAIIKADLPPHTFSFGLDLSAGYETAGTFTITLSTGQTYYINTSGTSRFFGVISSTPIEWATFSFNNNYLVIDNFVFGSACDATPPVLSLPNDFTVEATNFSGATVNYTASATDNIDGAVPINCVPASGSTFGITTTTVSCTATDHSGNTATGSFKATVVDTTPPVISNVPSNQTIEATSAIGVTVSWTAPSATDAVDGNVLVNCSPASGGTFALGTTTVSCSATDSHGNISSAATFTVSVTDTQAPVPVVASLPTITGECSASVTAPSATDIYAGTGVGTTSDPISYAAQGTYTVHWIYNDGNGNSSTQTQTVIVKDTTAPSIAAPPALIRYTGDGATLCASMVSDAVLGAPTVSDNCGGVTYTRSGIPAGNIFPVGTTTVTYKATDVGGNMTTATQTVTILDNTPPQITSPPDISVLDNAAGSCGALLNPGTPVTSDNCGVASVVGNRSDGKALTALYPVGATVITWTVTDTSGNTASSQQNIMVSNPAPQVTITGPSSGTLYVVNTPVNFTGSFTDNAGDSHTAVWTFDGTPQAGSVNEATHTVTASHTFGTAGVYLVTLTVTDDCGQTGVTNQVNGFDALVVIYDPDAGFVTGGGWINSPAGAYAPNPSLVGKGNFGFISKYKKGANVPDGETEFQFKVANLNFHSTVYEWLVVAGARAQYKGSGTINGAGNYGFMLTAIDGEISGGGGLDKFRIKIWDKNNGDAVVYDNQMGAGIDDNPTTALAGGSIVIHK